MFIPVVNIALGLALVIGGATEKFGILGSSNSAIPIAVGVAIAVYGVVQIVREVRRTR